MAYSLALVNYTLGLHLGVIVSCQPLAKKERASIEWMYYVVVTWLVGGGAVADVGEFVVVDQLIASGVDGDEEEEAGRDLQGRANYARN